MPTVGKYPFLVAWVREEDLTAVIDLDFRWIYAGSQLNAFEAMHRALQEEGKRRCFRPFATRVLWFEYEKGMQIAFSWPNNPDANPADWLKNKWMT